MKSLSSIIILLFAHVYISINTNAIWIQQSSPVTTGLYGAWAVSENVCWMCGDNGVVIKTTNGGTQWTLVNAGVSSNILGSIYAFDENKCWIAGDNGTLMKTTNGGSQWTSITLSPPAAFIDVVHFFNANLGFALSDPVNNIWLYYITTNGGETWSLGANAPPSTGSEAGWNNSYCALDTGHIWWGTNNSKIYKGSFRGPFTGIQVESRSIINVFSIAFNNSIDGVASASNNNYEPLPNFLSHNGGLNWISDFQTYTNIYAIKGIPGTSYMWMTGGYIIPGYVFRSTNNGANWSAQLTFPSSNAGGCLSMVNVNCGWVGTIPVNSGGNSGKIYKYYDYVGIKNDNEITLSFKLSQNYPNPFNPSTKIRFEIPQIHSPLEGSKGDVKLIVYDVLGNEITTLVNENLSPGTYEAEWNASNYSSGIYYYRLTYGDFSETKKMILTK